MENNERDRKLDQWLDEALSQYSAAEPRLGLEQRVLANVAAEEKARSSRRGWWRWMPAFAAIAAVLVVMVAVRPYWEQKNTAVSDYVQTQNRAAEKTQNTDQLEPKRPVVADKEAKLPVRAAIMQPSAAPATKVTSGKDVAANELRSRSAEVQSKIAVPPPPSTSGYLSITSKKELDADFSRSDAAPRREVVLMNSPAAPPTAMKQGIVGGVVPGSVTRGAVQDGRSAAANASPVQEQTIPVNPPPEVVQAQNGVVSTEKVAAKQLRTMKGKAAGALAKTLEQKVDTVTIPGMVPLRTELKTVPLGPTQQFPTPAPLSEQEKLMLSAAKNMKNKPATEEKQDTIDGQSKDIEIKKIEIAPLPGPQKQEES